MGYNYSDSSGFKGPFPLNKAEIQKRVSDNYGFYLLANINEGFFRDRYKVLYVGRGHLSTRLKKREGKYTHFYFKVSNVEFTRFRIECEEFHRYGKVHELDNEIHPAKPMGNYKKCTERGCEGEAG